MSRQGSFVGKKNSLLLIFDINRNAIESTSLPILDTKVTKILTEISIKEIIGIFFVSIISFLFLICRYKSAYNAALN
jgi:hypothetical protein